MNRFGPLYLGVAAALACSPMPQANTGVANASDPAACNVASGPGSPPRVLCAVGWSGFHATAANIVRGAIALRIVDAI
jgi:hypothetical protein